MNQAKGNSILKYIIQNQSNYDRLSKGLREVKLKIDEDSVNGHLFRKLGLTAVLVKLLKCEDERVLKWILSIFTSCLLDIEFLKEVHEIGIPGLFRTFKTSNSKAVQLRACRVIGQQCLYGPSSSVFHGMKAAESIVSFIKESESDEEKGNAIKALRYLANSPNHQSLILKENGLYIVCDTGLSLTCEKLRDETLKTIKHFNKCPTSAYFNQLIKGTDNLLVFAKLYELDEEKVKAQVFEILLSVFSHHSSYSTIQEYRTNSQTLDYLCMAKLPFMIISELQSQEGRTVDESNLILALCKFCELNNQWKEFSFNVLPSYHERTWMQLTDCRGEAVLVALLSSKRDNLTLLQALFRGLLGVEYLHSNRVKVLYYCIKAKLLPLLAEIFDEALNKTCCDQIISEEGRCHHFKTEVKTSKTSCFSKEASKEILDLLENTSTKSHLEKNESPITFKSTSPTENSPPKLPPTVNYKQMNKIKFRTGKKSLEGSKKLNLNSKDDSQKTKEAFCTGSSEERQQITETKTDTSQNLKHKLDKQVQMWMNILEYIVRLLYQVVSIKEDISSICRQFLLRFYDYVSKACIVHPSAMKLLSAIAKNPSSIQYVLDILFIPKLAVDLAQVTFRENCHQCTLIKKGVNEFVGKLGSYFNHYHQYGQCEVANRLNPSKPNLTKYSCLVALTHVAKCPKLLHSFLLDHRGLDSLLLLLSSSEELEPNMHLYGIASICSIPLNLKMKFFNKYNQCLFCYSNHTHSIHYLDLEKKEKKKQLLLLTDWSSKTPSRCVLEEEEEKNCSFQFEGKVITANKEKLSMKNEVLKGMLQGSFSESLGSCVQIRDVNSLSMEMVIHFLYGCTCGVFYCQDINVYVELIFIAQMYFIPELQILAMHHLSNLLLPDNVFSFVECRANILGDDLIQHLFCSLMSQPVAIQMKEKWINQLLASSLRDTFIDSISNGLTRLLKITSSLCSCNPYINFLC